MAYKKVEQRKNYAEMESEIIQYWKENDTFHKSINNRKKKESYIFYDGPPFITGVPHYGTLLSSIVKDVVPRFWTMQGKYIERTWGWDCHGLPAENLVEKKLDIKDKRDVKKIGLEKYIDTCHTEMVHGGDEWKKTIDRIGRWVEFRGAYKTMDKDYMESVWWAFKTLYDKKKIYEGEKVLLYCSRCATPISKAEVAMDNSYREVTDPSVYVKFAIVDKKDTFLLAWTTTPWTLSANTALAINDELAYVEVFFEKETFIVASDLVDEIFVDEKNHKLDYTLGRVVPIEEMKQFVYTASFIKKNNHVVSAEFVSANDGTGIVHIAPAFGEDDYALAKKEKLDIVKTIDENGLYIDGRWKGKSVWDVNKEIAKTYLQEGVVFRINYIQHEYPHCHRCDTKLMYCAHPSWFMNIDGQREEMIEKNKEINWFPHHFKEKRFYNTIASAPDWNLSRDRFWATPLPVWRGKKKDGTIIEKVIGSYAELKELSGIELDDYHMPYVDRITFEYHGVEMKRVDKVMDCWFESGSMPFAQFHYPFENKKKFEQNFPGDFISEYVGQVRAWFYYMHAISIGLFGEASFKNVIVTGTIAGNDGRKMSKSYGNYTDPEKLLNQYSADALRYLLISSPLLNGEDYALIDKDVADVQRKLNTLWNSYSFFVLYANVDGWTEKECVDVMTVTHVLDRWILSRLHTLLNEIDLHMRAYDIPHATKPIMKFVDELSNWYIRRSRKRFWKTEDDVDKNNAYSVLYYVLTELSKAIAPFMPFVAEEIYINLTHKESVHCEDFPQSVSNMIDQELEESMHAVRSIISEGLKIRSRLQIKVRQPLSDISIVLDDTLKISDELCHIIQEELNVKDVFFVDHVEEEKNNSGIIDGILISLNDNLTQDLLDEGIAKEIVRVIQQMRKKAGYEIDDRILVRVDGIDHVIKKYNSLISQEVLTVSCLSLKKEEISDVTEEISFNDYIVTISIKK